MEGSQVLAPQGSATCGRARLGAAGKVRPGSALRVLARLDLVWHGSRGSDGLGVSWQVPAGFGSAGADWQGSARPGNARLGSARQASRGSASQGVVWQGAACPGMARHGSRGSAGLGVSWQVPAGFGSAGEVGRVLEWHGVVRRG